MPVPRIVALPIAAALVAGAVSLAGAGSAQATEITPTPSNGIFVVDGHGNGHGHGLSQYGARGAAIAGLSYDKILAFYYPGTALATGSAVPIRVRISSATANPTVLSEPGLTVTGVSGALPTANIDRYQAVPAANGFVLQEHLSGAWKTVKTISGGKLDFQSSDGTVTLVSSAGNRTYRGIVSAVETGNTAITVNSTSLDDYVRGVVPSEMPASWQAAAVQAQAVAARSYGRYFVNHPRDPNYDICDTTSCQVYGGMNAEQAGSNSAVTATSNKVLTYGGQTIFAEFSASNGGITSGDGTEPYFVTKLDPYDNAASGDPYLNWTESVAASDVASYYGLARVSQIQITGRAPGGQWGGLVTTGIVQGSYPGGAAASIPVTGVDLASAMGLSYSYFHIRITQPIGNLEAWKPTGGHTVSLIGWALDLSNGGAPVSVGVSLDGGPATRYPANLVRSDVQAIYHTGSAYHGFSIPFTVPSGSHLICVTAYALSGSGTAALGCHTVTIGADAVGHVDSLTNDGHGNYRMRGWTFDPDDHGGPGQVRIYVDSGGSTLPAKLSRPDVQAVWHLANALVGFDVTTPVPTGTHQLCARAVNDPASTGSTMPIQCFTIHR